MAADNLTILKGSSRLVNSINVRQGANIDDIEKSMIERGLIEQSNEDPKQKWDSEINNIAARLGVSLNPSDKKKPLTTSMASTSTAPMTSTPHHEMFKPSSFVPSVAHNEHRFGKNNDEDDPHNDDADDEDDAAQYNQFGFGSQPLKSPGLRSSPEQSSRPSFSSGSGSGNRSVHNQPRTEEQRNKDIINGVVDEIDENSFSLEKEKEEDLKSTMLEEIDELRSILNDEGVDLSRIEDVTKADPFNKVNDVLKSLRYKNDSCRYRTMAEEFILFGAQALEEIFDGKRVWLSRYRPDLSGWSTQLNSKLRRMRTDTSRVVSSVMHDFELGPGLRILLELVPNAFMYSRSKKRQSETPSIYNDAEISKHISGIRDNMESSN